MVIKMDYRYVMKLITEMLKIAKEVKKEIDHMEEISEDLYVFWESESSMEHAMRLAADLYKIKAMLEEIKKNIRILANVVKRFDENETSIKMLIESM